jgi:hypothetical protein
MPNKNQNTTGQPCAVNHPASEAWMAYLYGELPEAGRAPLAAHLQTCPECQARTAAWRETLGSLDEYQFPPARSAPKLGSMLRWAAAAAVVLGLGYGFGLMQGAASRAKEIATIRQQLLAETAKIIEAGRTADNEVIFNALREMSAAHQADYASLHKELETMAVLTEGSLRQAEQQIVTLASFTEPNPTPSPRQP